MRAHRTTPRALRATSGGTGAWEGAQGAASIPPAPPEVVAALAPPVVEALARWMSAALTSHVSAHVLGGGRVATPDVSERAPGPPPAGSPWMTSAEAGAYDTLA